MTYSQLNLILAETGLSPEKLAPVFSVANMTVRRWQNELGAKLVPAVHQWNIIESIYRLVSDGRLSTESEAVISILKDSTPTSFMAVTKGLGVSKDALISGTGQQDKIISMLSQIGIEESHKRQVDKAGKKFSYFKKMGTEWSRRISHLTKIVRSTELSSLEKLVAYGALFYLLTPIDLIPDHIPVVGLIDDFGILGFAVTYYLG